MPQRKYGKLVLPPEANRDISARFDGNIKIVYVERGQAVKKGQPLLSIDSNRNLENYAIYSPIDGLVAERFANSGEQTGGRVLLRIIDNKTLNAELSVFPMDLSRVKKGATVKLLPVGQAAAVKGVINAFDLRSQDNQGTLVRVNVDNQKGQLMPGLFVSAEIEVGKHSVPLAVKRSGLQAFRDFTVVYAKVGDEYEVRMLELGQQAGEWAEVLGGLKPGTEYVTENSYIIKADIEKSGASHDH